MKRRNAETGKMRRPVKRTKITEGMYGNSMVYLKLVLVWAAVVLADYVLEFRIELLWPCWMMLRSLYDSFKYQGVAFTVFFMCIALTSDMICFFFIPLQYIFFAATTYVWVQYVWYTFADKGICYPTVTICCILVYVEGALRADRENTAGGWELCRPLAAHCVGYPVVTLGFGVKSYVGRRLRLRRQRLVRAENEFYFQLMKDALPESALEQNQQSKEPEKASSCSTNTTAPTVITTPTTNTTIPTPTPIPTPSHTHTNGECTGGGGGGIAGGGGGGVDTKHMNGSVRRKKQEEHCHTKLDKLDKEEDKKKEKQTREKSHAHTNGTPPAPPDIDDTKGANSAKSAKSEKKEASTLREEKKKNKNKDKDRDNHSDSHNHKGTEQTKEQLFKELESTKDNHIRNHKECNSYKEKERDREREREREKEREREHKEREKERERERERDRELREARECAEELKRVKSELAAALRGEAEARRALAAAAAADRQRRADHHQLKQAHATLQHKVSVWRTSERAALERRLGEERRARTAAEHQLRAARQQVQQAQQAQQAATQHNGECENEWCRSRRVSLEGESTALRRELRRATDRADLLQRDLTQATQQVRTLEAREREREREREKEADNSSEGGRLAGACAALQERAAHLERSLSAETRVKLDLLSALGDAKRQIHIQEGLISKQEKEIEELKAQMLAVMPTEYVTPVSVSGTVSKLRLEKSSLLDPNASVYTPKQLCSDA